MSMKDPEASIVLNAVTTMEDTEETLRGVAQYLEEVVELSPLRDLMVKVLHEAADESHDMRRALNGIR